MVESGAVGIIANPFSGRDIRRLVAYGSVMDNMGKVRLIQRLLAGLREAGVRQVYYMPDPASLVPAALEGMRPADQEGLHLTPVLEEVRGESEETSRAAAAMARLGVGAIVTLGGDGTNRLVAAAAGRIPLMPLSTGTNNTFPAWMEPTLAGLAAGRVAVWGPGRGPGPGCRQEKVLRLRVGEQTDLALVDIALLQGDTLGARAVWEPASIRELVITQGQPTAIGLSAIAGQVCPVGRAEPAGAYLQFGRGTPVRAAIASGRFATLEVAAWRRLACGQTVELAPGPGVLALDGERLWTVPPGVRPMVELSAAGPVVINPAAVLAAN